MKSSIQDTNNQQDNTQQNNTTQQIQKSGIKSKKQPIQAKQKPIQAKQQSFEAKQKPIQAKQRPVQRNTGSSTTSGSANEAQIKANVSALTGTDVTDAKVHYNSDKPAQLQAEATAQGNQVHLATGKEQHLGHELTHVAQQKQGRVKPTIQANNGVGINNDPKLEKEADDIGAQAQSGKPIQAKSIQSANFNGGQQPVQAKFQNDSNNPMEQGYLTGDEASKVILGFKKSGFYRLILKESKIKNNSPALIDQILKRIAEGKDNKSTLKVSKGKDNNSYDNLANYGLVYKKVIELAPSQETYARQMALQKEREQKEGLLAGFKNSDYFNRLKNFDQVDDKKINQYLTQLFDNKKATEVGVEQQSSLNNDDSYLKMYNSIAQKDTKTSNFFSEFKSKTLKQLLDSLETRADWHTVDISDMHRNYIRKVLEFVKTPGVMAVGSKYTVDDTVNLLRKHEGNEEAEIFEPLGEYIQEVQRDRLIDDFDPNNIHTLGAGVWIGQQIRLLKQALPTWMIKPAVDFNRLLTLAQSNTGMAHLKEYRENSPKKPFFQHPNDIKGFVELDKHTHPINYGASNLKDKVRNYHRFQFEALEQLKVNFNAKNNKKPVTLILHSSLDKDGAFVADSKLTQLIKNQSILTLMIEGKTQLSEYKDMIGTIAKAYGPNKKLDQVMFAGHGAATNIELAGNIKQKQTQDPNNNNKIIKHNEIEQETQSIDIRNKADQAREIFDEVLNNMNEVGDQVKEEHRRILFNACLTNSVSFEPGQYANGSFKINDSKFTQQWFKNTDNADETRTQMTKWLADNQNLVSFVTKRANTKKVDLKKVVGSMASHGALDLFDSNNNLELLSSDDPKLTAKDKMEYVIAGNEPEGVMSALAVCWLNKDANYQSKLKTAVKNRAQKDTKDDWNQIVIETLLGIIVASDQSWNDFHLINGMTMIGNGLAHIHNAEASNLVWLMTHGWKLNKRNSGFFQTIFDKAEASSMWKKNPVLGFKFYQAYSYFGFDKQKKGLIAFLASDKITLLQVRRYLDPDILTNAKIGELLSDTANDGSLKLALAAYLNFEFDTAKAYLTTHYTQGNKFDSSDNTKKVITNVITVDQMTQKLFPTNDVDEAVPANQNAAAQPNVTLYGGNQKVHVKSYTKKTKVSLDATPARKTASAGAGEFAKLSKGTSVHVFGYTGEFYAIEYKHQQTYTTAFVHYSQLQDVKSLAPPKIKVKDSFGDPHEVIPFKKKVNNQTKFSGLLLPNSENRDETITFEVGEEIWIVGKLEHKTKDGEVRQLYAVDFEQEGIFEDTVFIYQSDI